MKQAVIEELSTIDVLWRRDMKRFFRERTRIAGAVIQPLLFWVIIGTGMSPSFQIRGASNSNYFSFFFPGIMAMMTLFSAIFATMSVIEDRHSGFLQGVLIAPGSRAAVVIGKVGGASTIAVAQTLILILFAPLAGFQWGTINVFWLLAALISLAFTLSALGFAVAWLLDSVQGYHVVMSIFLIPAWVLSGAIFPVQNNQVLASVSLFNPLSYGVSLLRRSLDGSSAAQSSLLLSSGGGELAALLCFVFFCVGLATWACYRRR